jgi:ribose transport system substrate-binding protein
MGRKRGIVAVAVVALAMLAAGCGGSSSGGSSNSDEIVVGLSNSSVASSWRPLMVKNFEEEAQRLKDAGEIKDYVAQNADGTAARQVQQIQTMVNQGVNLLLVDAASETALNSAINQAVARGVTVVSFDNPVTTDEAIIIHQDEPRLAGETAKKIGELAGGKGTVVMMNGIAGSPLSDERERLAEEQLKQFPDIKIVKAYADWNGAKAKQKMATILSANPDIAGVWTQGSMAPGISEAFKEAGKPLPPIVADGLGGFLNTWDDLRKKEDYETVGIVVPPKIVQDALWVGMAAMDGYEPKEQPMVLSHPLITNENLDEYLELDTPAGEAVNLPLVGREKILSEYMVKE